ncbi:exported hypothetical protein [Candidatus Sulfobium mesophilum]|uniref:Lipoprotein n=1 Tax=Candidatus Sulfobium mesophilum TaxID=2016548 RepID=A0A2U3QIY3_9BACT|nr:exported hypothetical protein [Candidatus Sulfobium mesophilum]
MLRNAARLFLISVVVFVSACAGSKIEPEEMPSYEGRAFSEIVSEKKGIKDIETKFAILFEKKDSEVRGDAALEISRSGDMSLRVYSLGFLAMELTSRDGQVRATPALDRGKKLILTRGLRDCLFWWDMEEFSLFEEDGHYLLRGPDRELWIDKKTFLPARQNIYFEDGKVLNVYYGSPTKEDDVWYQSKIRIEYLQYSVTFTVKHMSFKS